MSIFRILIPLFILVFLNQTALCEERVEYSGYTEYDGRPASLYLVFDGNAVTGTLSVDPVCEQYVHLTGVRIDLNGTATGPWEDRSTTITGTWTGGDTSPCTNDIITGDPAYPTTGTFTISMTTSDGKDAVRLVRMPTGYGYIFPAKGRRITSGQHGSGQIEPVKETSTSEPVVIFNNWNVDAVYNGAECYPSFTIDQPYRITYIDTYHWNDAQGKPEAGTISLVADDGTTYGPWKARGEPGMYGVPNAGWICSPNVVIPAGTYTIVDSDPETWSQNFGSNGCGFSKVMGVPESEDEDRYILLDTSALASQKIPTNFDIELSDIVYLKPGQMHTFQQSGIPNARYDSMEGKYVPFLDARPDPDRENAASWSPTTVLSSGGDTDGFARLYSGNSITLTAVGEGTGTVKIVSGWIGRLDDGRVVAGKFRSTWLVYVGNKSREDDNKSREVLPPLRKGDITSGKIKGKVIYRPTGKPVADAQVEALVRTDKDGSYPVVGVKTKQDGTFEIDVARDMPYGVDPGNYKIHIRKPYRGELATKIAITVGQDLWVVEPPKTFTLTKDKLDTGPINVGVIPMDKYQVIYPGGDWPIDYSSIPPKLYDDPNWPCPSPDSPAC